MNRDEYIKTIKKRLESSFDFLPNGEYLGKQYDLAAIFRSREEQTVLFRSAVMDWNYSNEAVLLSCVSNGMEARQAVSGLKDITKNSAKPSRHHRRTKVILVLYSDGWQADEEVIKLIKRYHYSKSFRLGFYGWCEAQVLLADITSGKIISNYAGRSAAKYFAPAEG